MLLGIDEERQINDKCDGKVTGSGPKLGYSGAGTGDEVADGHVA